MEIVSNNTQAEISRKKDLDDISFCLIDLAANILRVIRGAGRPEEICMQIINTAARLKDFKSDHGYGPSSNEVFDMLYLLRAYRNGEPLKDRAIADHTIICGALQIAASTLLGQNTQASAGHREMYEGLIEVQRLRTATRDQYGKPQT